MIKDKEINFLGIIGARGGSKRILDKNIANLNGNPLIYYAIREAKASKLLDAFIVSTDDKKIADISKSLDADVPFLRPDKYASDSSRDIDYLNHALSWVEENRGWKPKAVVMISPTCPTRTAEDIDGAIELFKETGVDTVRTAIDVGFFLPYKMCRIDYENGNKLTRAMSGEFFKKYGQDVPSQFLPKYCYPIAYAYVVKADLIKQGVTCGNDMRAYMVDHKIAVDIDSYDDLKVAEELLKNKMNL